MTRFVIACVLACVYGVGVDAQLWDRLTNPKVKVTLKHAPGLGLSVRKLVFAPMPDATSCATQFLDSISGDFVAAGVEVLDREHLERILNEHKFNLSGHVDSSTSARLGRMTGAEAIVFVRVNRCEAKQDALREQFTDKKGVVHYTHRSKTTADFGASVKTVDLTTGRTFAAVQIDEQTMRENRAEHCCPEYPSMVDAMDDAVAKGVVKVHRMFFPWTEDVELHYFDDEPCDLKTAFRLLSGGDTEGALRRSIANAENCVAGGKVKPKVVWHAQYNVAMSHFILGDHENALHFFSRAAEGGGGSIVARSMTECRRAIQLAEQMKRIEDPRAPSAVQTARGGDAAADSLESRLQKLKRMLDQGLITKADYDSKKAELLKAF